MSTGQRKDEIIIYLAPLAEYLVILTKSATTQISGNIPSWLYLIWFVKNNNNTKNNETKKTKLTEAIANLSGNSSIAIDMAEVSQAVPPNAPSALNRKLNTTNSVVAETQAQKLKARKWKSKNFFGVLGLGFRGRGKLWDPHHVRQRVW